MYSQSTSSTLLTPSSLPPSDHQREEALLQPNRGHLPCSCHPRILRKRLPPSSSMSLIISSLLLGLFVQEPAGWSSNSVMWSGRSHRLEEPLLRSGACYVPPSDNRLMAIGLVERAKGPRFACPSCSSLLHETLHRLRHRTRDCSAHPLR
jgi:hypothetical protein